MIPKNTICLWYDKHALEAATFYADTFPDSAVKAVHHAPGDYPSGKAGDVLTVDFTVLGTHVVGLNGGPIFKFSEAVSLIVLCDTQEEIDHYWNALSQGGDPAAQQCGWLKDKYGLSWQITPSGYEELITSPDRAAVERYMAAMMKMKKLEIEPLKAAFEGR